jgi:hypothetical protein
VAVEPDAGAVVDAVEMEPDVLSVVIGSEREFGAVPPRLRKLRRLDGRKVVAVIEVGVDAILHQARKDGGRHADGIPTVAGETGHRDGGAVDGDAVGRGEPPAFGEDRALERTVGRIGHRIDAEIAGAAAAVSGAGVQATTGLVVRRRAARERDGDEHEQPMHPVWHPSPW